MRIPKAIWGRENRRNYEVDASAFGMAMVARRYPKRRGLEIRCHRAETNLPIGCRRWHSSVTFNRSTLSNGRRRLTRDQTGMSRPLLNQLAADIRLLDRSP